MTVKSPIDCMNWRHSSWKSLGFPYSYPVFCTLECRNCGWVGEQIPLLTVGPREHLAGQDAYPFWPELFAKYLFNTAWQTLFGIIEETRRVSCGWWEGQNALSGKVDFHSAINCIAWASSMRNQCQSDFLTPKTWKPESSILLQTTVSTIFCCLNLGLPVLRNI